MSKGSRSSASTPVSSAGPKLRRAQRTQRHGAAVLDRHPLRAPRRARGVDHVGEVAGRRRAPPAPLARGAAPPAPRRRPGSDPRPGGRQPVQPAPSAVSTTAAPASASMKASRSARIGGIERHVGAARLEDRQQRHHQLRPSARGRPRPAPPAPPPAPRSRRGQPARPRRRARRRSAAPRRATSATASGVRADLRREQLVEVSHRLRAAGGAPRRSTPRRSCARSAARQQRQLREAPRSGVRHAPASRLSKCPASRSIVGGVEEVAAVLERSRRARSAVLGQGAA